jgi:hypothetical protein
LLDRDVFGERTDSKVIWPGIDLIAGCELPHSRPDSDDHAGHVVAQNEWCSVGQDSLELSTLDLGIELVDTAAWT